MADIEKRLYELADREYAEFQAKLTPTVDKDLFIGVRVPVLREFAKTFAKSKDCDAFLSELPHKYYDENMLHSVIIGKMKDYEKCLEHIESFLPYIDNWAVCDTLRPAVFAKHKAELLPHIKKWIASEETYTCRFGIDMLMTYYLDDAFEAEFLELPLAVESDEYYVKMMIAWFYATALAKQWNDTIPYIEKHLLADWTHRKTIQKAIESFRISKEQKSYLRELK